MIRTFLLSCCTVAAFAASAPSGMNLFETSQAANPHDVIIQALPKAGFSISDDRDMNGPYLKQFGSTSYDIYHTITIYDLKTVHDVLKTAPNFGAFVPYTLLISKPKGAKETTFGFISTTTIATALGIDDKKALHHLSQSEKNLVKGLKNIDPSVKIVKPTFSSLLQKDPELFFTATYKLTPKDNAISKKEEIQTELESALEVAGFKIANITKLTDEFEKAKLDDAGYEFYETYSICKLGAIYSASKVRPEAGIFAPCSVFFYKKKGENRIVMGMPTTKNWVKVANITDPEIIATLKSAESIVIDSLKSITE